MQIRGASFFSGLSGQLMRSAVTAPAGKGCRMAGMRPHPAGFFMHSLQFGKMLENQTLFQVPTRVDMR
jgi:hypothetical protein